MSDRYDPRHLVTIPTGEAVPGFSLVATDGTKYEFDPASPSADATVVVFVSNACPYSRAWHDRINRVALDYESKDVRMVQVNPNDASLFPVDSIDGMRERVEAGEFATPYLKDETQQVAHQWGARVTPHVFIVDRDGRLRYSGNPDADHDDPSQNAAWMRAALDELLAGRELSRTTSELHGCTVKWRP
jgi:protein-disulfide isomerase